MERRSQYRRRRRTRSRSFASLQSFTLADLAPYTKEKAFAPDASDDHHLFYVGRDDVHGVLKHLFGRVGSSVYLNMFGYDDEELNDLIWTLVEDPTVTTVVTLDKSQSGGVHERKIIASDVAKDPDAFRAHFAIGTSATHQISHTKGGVLDGRVGFEGSTNWSVSGEGEFIAGQNAAGGPGFKAQNNTLMVMIDRSTLDAFKDELVHEHQVVAAQGGTIKVV
jgi:hypothetical protein